MSAYDETCIFCKIAAGEFNTEFVTASDHVVAFNDINPIAPVHVLIIPKEHVVSAHELGSGQEGIWQEMLEVAKQAADLQGVSESGYRLVTNAGPDSGQEVPHLHLHLLGGRKLKSLG